MSKEEIVNLLIENDSLFYELMHKAGCRIRCVELPGMGISYYVELPSGEVLVPVERNVISKKPLNEVNHWTEGWIGYERYGCQDEYRGAMYRQTGIHQTFLAHVRQFNSLPDFINKEIISE